MYRHLEKLEAYTGIKITTLRSKHNFDDLLKKYRWPTMNRRWCTSEKIAATKKYFNKLKREHPDTVFLDTIGFAVGEEERTRKKAQQGRNVYFPLIDRWKMTEPEALAYCRSHGFDWGGLYDLMGRVSCFCCPLSAKHEVKAVKDHFPELWDRMIKMEEAIYESEYKPWFKNKMGVEAYGRHLDYSSSLLDAA